ncbi:MAG: hypothetical protein IK007_07530 [Lachnospiraceae bacterium]|nr:hypothetical protein [Lachnospiraceae bacterium]
MAHFLDSMNLDFIPEMFRMFWNTMGLLFGIIIICILLEYTIRQVQIYKGKETDESGNPKVSKEKLRTLLIVDAFFAFALLFYIAVVIIYYC